MWRAEPGPAAAQRPRPLYLLLDSNVTAGYYLPRSLGSKRARVRIQNIFDSVRSGQSPHFLYIPNFCVAEVFSVFAKYSFGAWNRHVPSTIDTRVYKSLVEQFRADIHNGRFLYHYELARYHILGIDLVAPVDHYYRFSRSKKKGGASPVATRRKKGGVAPMATLDHLIISMGIHLARIHGSDRVGILTADDRLTNILGRCRKGIDRSTIKKLKLDLAAQTTGMAFGPDIFPKFANLKASTNAELRDLFGAWPLPVGPVPKVYRWLKLK